MTRHPMIQPAASHALQDLLDADMGSVIANTFHLMDVAEQELARVGDPAGAFMLLVPPPSFGGLAEDVYRHHCRELLARLAAHQDTRPGTEAEVLVALLDTSLKATLNHQADALVSYLWARVFPDVDMGTPTPEAWTGQVQEDLAAARRQLTIPDRAVKTS